MYDQNMLWKWCIFVNDLISETKYFLPMRNLWIIEYHLNTISVISWLSFVGGGNMSSHCLFHSYSGLGLWCLSPLSTIFQLYHGSFIGGGNQSTRRKRPTCHKSLANFITYSCIEYTSSWKAKPTKKHHKYLVSDEDSWEPLVIWPCHFLSGNLEIPGKT